MTATDVGLPDSAVVDGKRHLTPEWLRALGEIEQLSSLKSAYEKIADANVQGIQDALGEAEEALEALLARPVPNNIVASVIPRSVVAAADGVPHGLGTMTYIPMTQQSDIVSVGFWMMPIPSLGFYGMPVRNENVWALSPDLPTQPDQTWFTFTIVP